MSLKNFPAVSNSGVMSLDSEKCQRQGVGRIRPGSIHL